MLIIFKNYFWSSLFFFLLISSFYGKAQSTQGFFIDNQQPKNAYIPKWIKVKMPTVDATVKIEVNINDTIATVSNYLAGNNTNPYMTQIVTEPALFNQIKKLQPNILRFPGGNISNVYFWDQLPYHKPADVPDTILYDDKRKPRPEHFFVGKNDNKNSLSLNNYYELLMATNSTGTICVNAGYARYGTGPNPISNAAHYAADWVRFDKGRTTFWEVGNEDYGNWQAGYKINTHNNKDGQPEINNGQLYGKIFKAFSDSMHAAANEINVDIHIGATIMETPKTNKWDTETARNWNRSYFRASGNAADFFIIHSYFTQYSKNSDAAEILASSLAVTKNLMQYMKDMAQENNVLLKPIALTEWNIFAEGSKQQTSYISGMHAAIVLGELAKNKFGMACRWDLANGYNNGNDHGMFNIGDEPNMPRWSARPVYYYMYYFQKIFGDKMLSNSCSDANVLVYSSIFSDGKKGLVLINKDTTDKIASIIIKTKINKGIFYGYTLTGGNDNGQFSQTVIINGISTDLSVGGLNNIESINAWSSPYNDEIKIKLPAMAVLYVLVK